MKLPDTPIELLQNQPFFGGVNREIIETILERSEFVEVAAGDTFFREGDSASSVYVLEEGEVDVIKESEDGEACVLRRLGVGDCFGEMSLMDFKRRSATVLARENCRAIRITSATLHHVYTIDTGQFAMIEMNMGREVCRRLRDADNQLFENGHASPPEAME